jgi:DNA polymerase-3 subunit beta
VKISVERDVLLAQLQTVSRVASTRSAIQALSGVQLSVQQSGSELRATDMDVGLRVPLEGEVTRDGTVVLPARLMLDVIRSLPASLPVTLELRSAEQDVEVVSGNARFHIRTLRGDDFPPCVHGTGLVATLPRRLWTGSQSDPHSGSATRRWRSVR